MPSQISSGMTALPLTEISSFAACRVSRSSETSLIAGKVNFCPLIVVISVVNGRTENDLAR